MIIKLTNQSDIHYILLKYPFDLLFITQVIFQVQSLISYISVVNRYVENIQDISVYVRI
jgi:hypothetical protein